MPDIPALPEIPNPDVLLRSMEPEGLLGTQEIIAAEVRRRCSEWFQNIIRERDLTPIEQAIIAR